MRAHYGRSGAGRNVFYNRIHHFEPGKVNRTHWKFPMHSALHDGNAVSTPLYTIRPGDDECHVCPLCHGPVHRIRRRFIDRLESLIKPVQRYRCRMKGWGCDWEGNLP